MPTSFDDVINPFDTELDANGEKLFSAQLQKHQDFRDFRGQYT